MKKVLVTGGAGYIGSHVVAELLDVGFEVVSVDNYSNSSAEVYRELEKISGTVIPHYALDVCDEQALSDIIEQEQVEAVIHFAGFKAVGESIQKPLLYYDNNLRSTLSLCKACVRHQVRHFVFSSSATVYGLPQFLPLTEEHPLSFSPTPYGNTKLFIEQILRDMQAAHPWMRVTLLRYFNPIGSHPSALIGEHPTGYPNNLMPYLCQVAAGQRPVLWIFGNDFDTPDGTGVRDFIHVVDLARGHLAALIQHENASGCRAYNLGTGRGTSVLELVRAFESVNGVAVPFRFTSRREGDVAACWADASRARLELGWEANLSLEEMVRSSWAWQLRLLPSG